MISDPSGQWSEQVNIAEDMLRSHPNGDQVTDALIACIEECYRCAQACTACADACLGEEHVERLTRCIRLNLDCSDACIVTGNMLSRQTHAEWDVLRRQLEACVAACRACGAECESHAEAHEHCRICAEACRRCEEACSRLLQSAGS